MSRTAEYTEQKKLSSLSNDVVDDSYALRNNDSLAHVRLLSEDVYNPTSEHRIKVEFVTDMGERLENQPFNSSFDYSFDGQEIIYDTGILYLKSLERSYQAALKDVAMGTFGEYHAKRQQAFYEQGQIIKNWLNDDTNKSHILLFSLCPTEDEQNIEESKKQSFKPDRKMASIQLHSKNSDGSATTNAFSLDGLTPQILQQLFDKLGIDAQANESTLNQLVEPVFINNSYSAEFVTENIIDSYDDLLSKNNPVKTYRQGIDIQKNMVEANSFVSSKPEVYELYKQIIVEVASSLDERRVSSGLDTLISSNLSNAFITKETIPSCLNISVGNSFNEFMASELIDYLRQKAIPEYLTKLLSLSNSNTDQVNISNSGYGDIGAAGADAVASGKTYDGGCPTSGTASSTVNISSQAQELGLNRIVNNPQKLTWRKGRCVVPNCPSLKKNKEVDVADCSVCRDCQKKYDKGIDPVKEYKPSFYDFFQKFAESIIEAFLSEKDIESSKK
jgi:hypothetical protein